MMPFCGTGERRIRQHVVLGSWRRETRTRYWSSSDRFDVVPDREVKAAEPDGLSLRGRLELPDLRGSLSTSCVTRFDFRPQGSSSVHLSTAGIILCTSGAIERAQEYNRKNTQRAAEC